ncbi:hypothetical protein AVEN_52901-1 [Araneus ventricosus]|uniref:Uncharacterized protein n=1 Tax=Araneus ventricosus TaxID=182803 RepID=A0A4Y2FDV0_ARAVE|nr:hypothetical protein AVEN_52901-1 [Araneus ventricosus]
MFYKDTADEFDDTDVTAAGKNLGLKQRYERVTGGKIFDMCGILHIDLGTQPRLLIRGKRFSAFVESKRQFYSLSYKRFVSSSNQKYKSLYPKMRCIEFHCGRA